ncbi:hypothetical protein B0H17DRAFT_1135541 [Mycena rosella]|uniref:Uncharacterized protein n=1 Tax=Mycena rosella TaxID=1033263 RepID=A0AAD7DD95_MYCRO|nr:hypothetical protein B0H17DRAFT_1135541 [Mycena rosella]
MAQEGGWCILLDGTAPIEALELSCSGALVDVHHLYIVFVRGWRVESATTRRHIGTKAPFKTAVMLKYTFDPAMHEAEHRVLNWVAVHQHMGGGPARSVLRKDHLASPLCLGKEPGFGRTEDLPPLSGEKVLEIQAIDIATLELAKRAKIMGSMTSTA